MSSSASPTNRRRFTFSLRSLFILVTLCAIVAAIVHWLFFRERPYLYVSSNYPNATVYLDGISLGRPPVSLRRREVERLFPGKSARIAPGPLRGSEAEFGVFIKTIEKQDGTRPLLWLDAGEATEPRMSMPYGKPSRVFIGNHDWPWSGIQLFTHEWLSWSIDKPRGELSLSQDTLSSTLSLRLHFPDRPLVGSEEINTLNEDAAAVLKVFPKRHATKLMFHALSFKSHQWEKMADGHQIVLEIAALPPGEYWIQGCVENSEGQYCYQDDLLPVWFRITDDGELRTMTTVTPEGD